MSLFRRLRRDKDDESLPEAEKSAPAGPSPTIAKPPAPVPTGPAPGPTTAAPAPAHIPPPLPDRPIEPAPAALTTSDPLSKCFVCGTLLVDHRCSTCRMTWVE